MKSRSRNELYVVYQSDFLSHLESRFVIPLINLKHGDPPSASRLNPIVEIADDTFVVATHLAFAAQVQGLGNAIASLENKADELRDAIDFLTLGL